MRRDFMFHIRLTLKCVALFNGLVFFSKVQTEAARTTAESAKHVEEVCFDESA